MQKRGNILKTTATALLFIVLEAAALLMIYRNDIIHRQWFMRGIMAVDASILGGAGDIRNYFNLRKANDSLAKENSALRERLYSLAPTMPEDTGSKAGERPGFTLIPARIAKGTVNKQHNYFILDKGKADGIEPQMGVITNKAVIGITEAVSEHYSYVISFLSPGISISARLGHSGIVGTLQWTGEGSRHAVLRQIPLHTEIVKGDTVYTSGFSNLYPPDIPLGTVTGTTIVDGASINADIRLLQEFRGLEYVEIVRNEAKAEVDSLLENNLGKEEALRQ